MGTDQSGMLSNTRTVRIEWGDCDPAGIVFFPRYFELFDHSTTLLIERALGMRKREFYAFYAFDGYPVVDTRARFLAPTRFGDDVVIETTLAAINRASFEMTHRLSRDGELAVEGFETRVWVVRDASRSGGFRAEAIPAEVVAKLKATG
jgi:4-hydroxybenzoyl-CoA thioesterase